MHASKADSIVALNFGTRRRSAVTVKSFYIEGKNPVPNLNIRLGGSERFGEEKSLPAASIRIPDRSVRTLYATKRVQENDCFNHEYFIRIVQAFSMSDISQTRGEGVL
jgi:hypothetical protein